MEGLQPIKIHLSGLKGQTFVCVKCGLKKEIDSEKLRLAKQGAKLRCKCGEIYQLEMRKCYRKEVRLPARYKVVGRPLGDEAIIEDISMGGLSFTCLSTPKFRVGDTLSMTFRLSDQKRTEIRLDVEVKRIQGNKAGAEISEWYYHHKDLGFFLLP